MDPILEGFFDRFQALIDDCKVQIAGLTQTELDWSHQEKYLLEAYETLSVMIKGAKDETR